MERGLAARLSPNEEITLRRAAQDEVKLGDLSEGHIDRLVSLGLVSLDGNTITITNLGKQRIFAS